MLYFAYGANTNIENMAFRCPDATKIGRFTLPDWKLVFKSVADIENHKDTEVHGVLWNITKRCELALDRYEGFPHLYGKRYFVVRMPDGDVQDVMFYKMNAGDYQRPSDYYFDTIRQGYIANDLPLQYLHDSIK